MNAPDLHVHSMFSAYDGMGSPQAVVDRAVELGWSAVCLTEHGWMGSAPALYKAAMAAKIKPILGCEMYVVPDDYLVDGDKDILKQSRHLTVLALSFEGYQNLVTWVNASMQRPAYYNKPRISMDQMAELAPFDLEHNVVLSGCLGGELCQCLMHDDWSAPGGMYVDAAKSLFPNFYIELQNHGLAKFIDRGFQNYDQMVAEQTLVRERLLTLARDSDIPVIITNDSHFQSQEQRKPHLAMLARKQWRRGAEAHEKATSDSSSLGFAGEYAYWRHYMQSMEKLATTLPAWAEKQSIESIHDIVEAANVTLEPLDTFSYTLPRSAHSDPVTEIRERSKARLKTLVARHGEVANERFEFELAAMENFAHYLLIYSDIVRMARSQGIYTWTRGSAANSLVNYCLRIHEIDPIHYNLMFERFFNPARAKFPDVDIDIEAHRQPDVVRMITEYMAETEGADNVRGICTYSTLSNRNAFRMMAEAAGVDKEKVNELAKLLPQMIDSGMVESEEEAYEQLREELGIDIHGDAAAIFDAIGGVSQHACAFALGTTERPLSRWVPNYRIGSSDALVTQFNMKWIEELGFQKLDLLRLDTLSIMHSVARMLGKDIGWLDEIGQSVPGVYDIEDELTFKMLRAGRTDGVHSLQGGTQRRGCIEVVPESDRDLVAIQALYRPSGTRTDLDKTFVARKHGREEWEPLNELTDLLWSETFGLPIYQEQIMQMGAEMGMTGEEIDDLYKAIKTAKGVGRGAAELFEQFEPTFRKYADKLMPKDQADEIWARWDAMQGYTFNKGHATSYAILALKTAYLKAHYPQEFLIALLERFPDNPRYVAAAIAEGFSFEPPDVNLSAGGFSRGRDDKHIRVGLLRISGIGPGAVGELVRNQPFASVEDVKERTNGRSVKAPTIEALADVGAFGSLGIVGDKDDNAQFRLLKFVPWTPKAFAGCKPNVPRRPRSRWEFTGIEKGVAITEGKRFCAKLFWIPEGSKVITKTAPSGAYHANLLTVVDVNGIAFDLRVGDSKQAETKMIRDLGNMHGAVFCAEGQIKMPFETGANLGFQFWGISGAEDGNPQMWHTSEDDAAKIIKAGQIKKQERKW